MVVEEPAASREWPECADVGKAAKLRGSIMPAA
jgi:hypothetical protein